MLGLIVQGISFGFTAGTIPGPFIGYLVNTTLTHGGRKSIRLIVTPLITDGPIIVLMVFLLRSLPPEVIRIIQLIGGLFVLSIARGAWKQLRAGVSIGDVGASPVRRTMAQGIVMNFLNPGPYIWWGTIAGPLLVKGLAVSIPHGVAFLIAFYVTLIGLLAAWVIVFDRLRGLNERATQVILLVSIAVLVVFGGLLIAQGIGLVS